MSFLSAVKKILHTPTDTDTADGSVGIEGPGDDFLFRRFLFSQDADAVCRFQRETYELNFPGFIVDQPFLVGFRYDLRRASNDSNHALFIVERHQEHVAFLWVVVHENSWTGERSGYINNVYVAPSVRSRGLGKFLMGQAEDFFRRMNITRIRLEVTAANDVAVGLYRAMGYQTQRYIMEKDVPPPPENYSV